jgi:hypothetical protein
MAAGAPTGFTGTPGGGYQFGGNPDVNKMLGAYVPPTPKELEQLSAASTTELQRAQGAQAMPTFEDMFNRYVDVSNREASRSAAQINEAMGARGARYGSDLARAQADLRQRQTQDIMSKAGEYTLGLEQSRQNLLNIAGQGLSGVGGGKYAAWMAGMGGMQGPAGYGGAAAPPPGFGPGAAWGTQWGPGGQIAT